MGFIRDFENEIKIFFVLVTLVILVGWFGAIGSLSLLDRSSYEETPQESAMEVVLEESEPEALVEEVVLQEGPVQYANESIGISFEYPAGWFVYDTAAWEQDNVIAPCETQSNIENTIIVSRKNLGRCVGVQKFNAWPGDLLISFSEKEWKDFPFVLQSEENVGLGEVGGVSAAAYLFNENSLNSRKQAVRFYVNTQERGYIIEFVQDDLQGNYDPIFDEILASVQWF